MVWKCKQHGEGCQSYVQGEIEWINEKGITPKNIEKLSPADQGFVEKAIIWVD
jgi:hypothetical protein